MNSSLKVYVCVLCLFLECLFIIDLFVAPLGFFPFCPGAIIFGNLQSAGYIHIWQWPHLNPILIPKLIGLGPAI